MQIVSKLKKIKVRSVRVLFEGSSGRLLAYRKNSNFKLKFYIFQKQKGFVAIFINADLFFSFWLKKIDGNIILGYFAIVNVLLISGMYPLIIIAYLAAE